MPGPQDKEVDFSNYFKNQPKNNKSAIASKDAKTKPGKTRLIVMIIIMLGLAGALAYVLYQNYQGKVVTVPSGYRLVAPPNQPAHLEKIQ